jgi:type I restriction enzyme S subunit
MRETLVKTEEFKDSPVGRIPKVWNYLTINDCLRDGLIIDVQDGNHGEAHPKTDEFVSEGIPFVMAKDLVNGQIHIADCHKITWHQYQSLRVGFARPGDVLLSHKGTIGLTAIVPDWLQHVMLTPQVTYYRVSEGKKLSGKFLFWFFQSPLFQQRLEVLSAQSTRSYIGITLQKTLSILVPPFDEQKRIAELLDTVDAAIAHTSSLIAKLKLMKAGLLHDLLTRGLDENGELRDAIAHPEQFKESALGLISKDWEVCQLSDFYAVPARNGLYKPAKFYGRGVLMIHMPQMFRGLTIDVSDAASVYVNPSELERFSLAAGDLVFARRSLNLEGAGRCSLVPAVSEPTTFESSIIRVRLSTDKLRPIFANYFLNSETGFRLRLPLIRQVAVSGVSSEDIASIPVPCPPPEEQDAIIKIIDTHNTRIRAEEAYRDKLKLQKQGLMHDLLTGKVRVEAK